MSAPSPALPGRSSTDLASLQCLRGCAVLLVVLAHAGVQVTNTHGSWPLPDFVRAGAIGVDLFFVISGFIMYHTGSGGFGVPGEPARFLRRRFLRIYLPYWIVFATTLVAGGSGALPAPAALIRSFFLLPQVGELLVRQSWTLVHEVRFYVVFGLLLVWPLRRAAWGMVAWAVGSWAVLLVSYFEPASLSRSLAAQALNYLFHPNSLEFLLGVLAAAIVQKARTTRTTDRLVLAAGLASSLAALLGYTSIEKETRYRELTVFMLPSFLLVLGSTLCERRAAWWHPRLLGLLGNASYSVYLTHWLLLGWGVPLFVATGSRAAVVAQTWMLAGLVIVCGWVFHRTVERPLHGLARRWTQPKARVG